MNFGMGTNKEEGSIDWIGYLGWSGATLIAYYGLATSPTWLVKNPTLLDLKSIKIELLAFIVVMAIGEISNSGSAQNTPEFERVGALKVALFVILAVLPEYMQYVMGGEAIFYKRETDALVLNCIFNINISSSYFNSYSIVYVMLIAGLLCALCTAHKLYFIDKDASSRESPLILILAITSSVIALLMLAIYLFLKYLDKEQTIDCSNPSYSGVILMQCFSLVLLAAGLAMWIARAGSVYFYIPLFIDRESPEPRALKTAYNQIILIIICIFASILAYYYREKLLDNTFLLLIFAALACLAIAILANGFYRLKNYYPHAVLMLLGIVVVAVITFLAADSYSKRHNEKLKLIPLDEETIEYLNRLKGQ